MPKFILFLVCFGLSLGAAFGGPSAIKLTAPQVTAWTQVVSGTSYTATAGDLTALNFSLASAFQTIEDNLNRDTFSKLNNLGKLSKGFANANAVAFDNASLKGYQNYDLFAVALGFDLGLAVPSLDPLGLSRALDDLSTQGDIYAGVATGGVVVQVGFNLKEWVPDLYGSARFGSLPSSNVNGTSFQQTLFGVGVNYPLVKPYDYALGLFHWRGVSAGTGFTYSGSSTNVDVVVADQQTSPFSATIGSGPSTTVQITPVATNNRAKLTVNTQSFVVPFDLMTSVQVLWLFNLGLDLGVDVAFSGAQVKLGGASDLVLKGISGATMTPGTAVVSPSDSSNGGDLLLPRIGTSVGIDLAVFKFDVPISFYPLSNAFVVGVTGGIVW
jgi:hypothetical protein